jgi:hypothetical protein
MVVSGILVNISQELESGDTGSDRIDYNIVASTIYMYREYLADIRRDIDGLKARIEKQIVNSDNLGRCHAPDNRAASVESVEQLPMVGPYKLYICIQ